MAARGRRARDFRYWVSEGEMGDHLVRDHEKSHIGQLPGWRIAVMIFAQMAWSRLDTGGLKYEHTACGKLVGIYGDATGIRYSTGYRSRHKVGTLRMSVSIIEHLGVVCRVQLLDGLHGGNVIRSIAAVCFGENGRFAINPRATVTLLDEGTGEGRTTKLIGAYQVRRGGELRSYRQAGEILSDLMLAEIEGGSYPQMRAMAA